MPMWKGEVSAYATVGRGPDVRNVLARVGESHTAVVPTSLDSFGSGKELLIPGHVCGHSDDECSSARSEFRWGEMENIRKMMKSSLRRNSFYVVCSCCPFSSCSQLWQGCCPWGT